MPVVASWGKVSTKLYHAAKCRNLSIDARTVSGPLRQARLRRGRKLGKTAFVIKQRRNSHWAVRAHTSPYQHEMVARHVNVFESAIDEHRRRIQLRRTAICRSERVCVEPRIFRRLGKP